MQKHNVFRNFVGRLTVFAGSLLMFTAMAHGTAMAQAQPPPTTPEIDLGSLGNAIAFLCGGLLLFIGLRRKPQAVQEPKACGNDLSGNA